MVLHMINYDTINSPAWQFSWKQHRPANTCDSYHSLYVSIVPLFSKQLNCWILFHFKGLCTTSFGLAPMALVWHAEIIHNSLTGVSKLRAICISIDWYGNAKPAWSDQNPCWHRPLDLPQVISPEAYIIGYKPIDSLGTHLIVRHGGTAMGKQYTCY